MTEESSAELGQRIHEKGQRCMDAVMKVVGEEKNGQFGVRMDPENITAIANTAINLLIWTVYGIEDSIFLKALKENSLKVLQEAFENQEEKLKSKMN